MLIVVPAHADVTCRKDTFGSTIRCSDGRNWRVDPYSYGRTIRGSDGTVCTRDTFGSNPAVRCKKN